jgi:hypothetical protein
VTKEWFWIGNWIYWSLLVQPLVITINYSAIANLPNSKITRTRSSQSPLAVSWQRICNDLNVTAAHIKSSFHVLNLLFTGWPTEFWSELSLSLILILRQTVSRPVCLGILHPHGVYDQIFITVRQLRVCWCGALSLTGGRVSPLQLLLALASAVILRSESRGTRGHMLLSQIQDFPFRRPLRLTGFRWRYSTPPPRGILT